MVNSEICATVDVSTAAHQYPVIISRNGLNAPELLCQYVTSSQVMIVTNQTITPLYLHFLKAAFVGKQCDVVILPDGEEYKNQQSLFTIYDSLIKNGHHRDTTIVALGGGVVGDIAGLAASTYQRGVQLVHIPTTLLAQIDSSIGGKTAINHPLGKNMIGSFYQPHAVIIDLSTLKSLPEREFRAGLAEMIKYGLLAGGHFLFAIEEALKNGLNSDSPQLPYLISQCCQIKAEFVEKDEKEQGARALLNLGHTFAHALETYTHYQKWLHGEAVAIGLYCAAILSNEMGLIDKLLVQKIEEILHLAGLSYKIPNMINLDKLRELMKLDKKIKNNCLRFVLIKKPGHCYLENQITENHLRNTLMTAVEGE